MKREGAMILKIGLVALPLLLSSCMPKPSTGGRSSNSEANSNTPSSVAVGYGRVLKDNPGILGAKQSNFNIAEYLDLTPYLINTNDGQFLIGSCRRSAADGFDIPECFEVLKDSTATPLTSIGGKWAFTPTSSNFLQVHTFYHTEKVITKYMDFLSDFTELASELTYTSLYLSQDFFGEVNFYKNFGFWSNLIRGDAFNDFEAKTLRNYSECNFADNAAYEPATFSTCYGYSTVFEKFKWAQDATVIYHELGHALIDVMINSRNNMDQSIIKRTNLIGNNEAGALAEGISDYTSYLINGRETVMEWALEDARRPLSESYSGHAAGISSDENSRLSYPAFIGYAADDPTNPFDEVHNNGQIVSHFLVALTKDLQSYCSVSRSDASKHVLYLLQSTLSELGDLTSSGVDLNSLGIFTPQTNTVNYNSSFASIWNEVNYPINFRSFFQTFAKYTLGNFINSLAGCYDQERFEQLLDMYGLLLFDNYNETGNNGNLAGSSTQVSDINRLRSTNIPKELIKIDSRAGKVSAFVFDKRSSVKSSLDSFIQAGLVSTTNLSTKIESDLRFNNGNGKVSPGEIVGIALNLFNDANSTMGGVQVLANDWHHADLAGDSSGMKKPCPNLEDEWPLPSEIYGLTTDAYFTTLVNECSAVDSTNGTPVCFIQHVDEDDTKWVTQEEYLVLNSDQLPSGSEDCLGGSSSTKDCFLRSIRGLDSAFYGKIDPKKTWPETFSSGGTTPTFNSFLFFEVNPWTPPGARFMCRFRVRFSNCSDCFSENYTNFTDSYYSEAAPFKVVNLEFTVVD